MKKKKTNKPTRDFKKNPKRMESKHITKENHQTMMVQTKEKEMKRE